MIFNMVGGGGGSGATLVVSSPVNVSVTVSKDDKSYTKNSGSMGSTTFKGLATGTWTVTISGNGQTATKTIEITADYAITLAFFSATINITYPANSTCVVTNSGGQTVASDTNTDSSAKTWTATVGATGTYTITATATDGSGKNKSQSVEITSDGQSVDVALSYRYYFIQNGSLVRTPTSVEGASYSKEGNIVKISCVNNRDGAVYFQEVDVSSFSTLVCELGATSKSWRGNNIPGVGISNNVPSISGSAVTSSVSYALLGNSTDIPMGAYTCDITKVTVSGYVWVSIGNGTSIGGNAGLYISNLYLE